MKALPWTLAAALFALPAHALAYGEPDDNGVPSHNERLLHVLTNQVRQAPHEWPGWDTSLASPEARAPLGLQPQLLAAARYHANDMANNGCFSHESCDGTPFQSRVSRFFDGPAGENIYTATGGLSARRAMTGWMNSDGHRTNILRPQWNWLGTGFSGAGQIYYVQNFGQTRAADFGAIPGGAYEDLGAGSVRVVANHYDPSGEAPAAFDAILGDTRVPMGAVVGEPGNQTFEATTTLSEPCLPLFFVAEAADGTRTAFPTEGALLVGDGCSAAYTAERRQSIPGEAGPVVIDANEAAGGCRCAAPARGALGAGWLAVLVGLPLVRRRRA